jgi:Uma2 family endonuclease
MGASNHLGHKDASRPEHLAFPSWRMGVKNDKTMSALPKHVLTSTEYLAIERAAETRSEFFDGEMFAMAGTTKNHARIVMNLGGELRTMLKGKTCEPFATDLRIKVQANGLYTYPDLLVVCGEQFYEDDHLDTLLNPTLLIEILSESTERYDRVKKFDLYRALPSLKEYVLVSQSEPRIEQFLRQPNDEWNLRITTDLTAFASFSSIACEISLTEIYDRVEFLPPANAIGAKATDG